MTVIIFGNPADAHVARVREKLSDYGCRSAVFHRYCLDHLIRIRFSSSGLASDFLLDGMRLDFAEVRSVWWRLKPVVLPFSLEPAQQVAEDFASKEWHLILHSMPYLLTASRWINPLHNHVRSGLKPFQLHLAQQVGLRIPDSVVTNDPEGARDLFRNDGRVVYKNLSGYMFPPGEFIFTTEVHEDQLHRAADEVKRAPGIFQELVPKRHELRVMVVGREVFACIIQSQRFANTKLDWRRSQLEDMFEATRLDDKLEQRLLAFHESAGLVYGAYDFIVPEAGEPLFLECNPAGQWLWLEDRVPSLRVADALARQLSEVSAGPHGPE